MKKIKIISVNISKEKGTPKTPVNEVKLTNIGIPNDAHSGTWHRQISMLGTESIEKFSQYTGKKINAGEFAENITTTGLELYKTLPLDKFKSDNIELTVTQIGKKCHGTDCSIFKETGNCIMPKEGIFVKVIKGGKIYPGTELEYHPKILKIMIITLSDRAYKGLYKDKSGPVIKNKTANFFLTKNRPYMFENILIPDDATKLKEIIDNTVSENFDLIFTTGGTGISKKDITVDTIKPLLEKEITGIMELIRVKYGSKKPNALISRSIAGTINNTLVYTLPGNPKAVSEYLNEILPTIEHSLYMINDLDLH